MSEIILSGEAEWERMNPEEHCHVNVEQNSFKEDSISVAREDRVGKLEACGNRKVKRRDS